MRFNNPTPTVDPVLLMMDPDGKQVNACMVASPAEKTGHVLAITCEPVPKLGPDPEIVLFYGGFDPAEVMNDLTKEAGFLALLYPVSQAEKMRERLGSVDYVSKS